MRAVAILVAVAMVAAGGLALLQSQTAERIRINESQRVLAKLRDVLPAPNRYNNAPQLDVLPVNADALGDETLPVYRARLDGVPVATVLTAVAPNGYVDEIRLIVGVDTDGGITGVRVLEHRETPGLGDGIQTDRSDWILAFDGRRIDDLPSTGWALRRDGGDFDHLTGATITSRAVVKAVSRAVQYYAENEAALFRPVDVPANPLESQPR